MAAFVRSAVAKKCTSILPQLESLLGRSNVIHTASQLDAYSHDEGHFPSQLPAVVVRPANADEVSALLKICNSERIPVTPFGTGTGLEGGCIPMFGGVSVDLQRMDRIVEVNAEDFDCVVEPGVTRNRLNEHLRDSGLFFTVDPGADASICGMVSTSASGTTSVRYGTMRQNVRNLEVVLADGRIIQTRGRGRRAWKSSAGLNLTDLFVGAEGTLGTVTAATVALHPRPQAVSAAVCPFGQLSGAVDSVVQLRQMSLPLARIELLDEAQMRACIAYSHLDMEPVPTLFLEFHGSDPSQLISVSESAKEICDSNGALRFDWSSDADRIAELWRARHTAYYAFLAQHPGLRGLSTDVCVPLSRLAECIAVAQSDMRALSLAGTIVGHVGEGNFHCLFGCDEDNAELMGRIREFSDRLVRLVGKTLSDFLRKALAVGGTSTGEHGVGLGKRRYQLDEFGAETLQLMKEIKRSLDPNGIMNPGKLLPDE